MRAWACAAAVCCSGCDDGRLETFHTESAPAISGLLDDFEDRDIRAGSDGWWYATDDETGPDAVVTVEAVADRGESRYAARVRAGPTLDYGAFLGLDVPGGVFDATAFDTLSFVARAEPPHTLGVVFLDTTFASYEVVVELTSDWQATVLPLAAFMRDDQTLDRSQITHLQFWIRGSGPAFELWIDDVRLLPPDP